MQADVAFRGFGPHVAAEQGERSQRQVHDEQAVEGIEGIILMKGGDAAAELQVMLEEYGDAASVVKIAHQRVQFAVIQLAPVDGSVQGLASVARIQPQTMRGAASAHGASGRP